ncbi:50S ribosomal protein L30 [Dyadobacter sp. LHD-138]|uniref:50S ribosomal protein L30 n=1 Tax=Dyadobacter sp. LHD-138 TaxID=3071413 RepID=UPI0027E13390|nr:50S ribosomal protein L30 [Dyadobacter sp. LHD-138]MDQ6478523.1 50S ribosomal protein L30 [Dyadobacter sp. LHD-138]
MSRVRITQIKSVIDRPERQKLTIQALGLGKINRSVEQENTDAIAGMIRKVSHLVLVEEI